MTIKVIPETKTNVEVFTFPDGQPHVRYTGPEYASVDLVMPIRNPFDFVVFLLTLDALKRGRCHLATLYIPYMMGARSDRVMQDGDSVCNSIVLKTIQDAKFARTVFLDIHNWIVSDFIKGAKNVVPLETLTKYVPTPEIIIQPDAGAYTRTKQALEIFPEALRVECVKSRDSKGHITLTMSDRAKEACKDKYCLIADDLCDGGGTFIAIREQIQPKHISLIVTHGIFSKGTSVLRQAFDQIVTTNSFFKEVSGKKIDVVDYFTIME